jgi:hypothetical protein
LTLTWYPCVPAEDDPALGEEDKALARFQVQRIKEAKRATRFALGGADGEEQQGGSRRGNRQHTLTHGGISLEELEELNSRCDVAYAAGAEMHVAFML